MKLLSNIAGKIKKSWEGDNRLVHFFCSNEGYMPINPPRWAKEFECPFCGCRSFYLISVDYHKRAWMCADVCPRSKMKKESSKAKTNPLPRRALEWPKFCEISGIGDLYHDVKFEDIDQSQGKIDFMLKFITNPRGIIFMQGSPGTGKTYAALAMCELYTRRDTSCLFTTQTQMLNNWLDTFKSERVSNYIEKVNNVCLLVIDDFGTSEVQAGFLRFFMDLINNRLQWSNKGTVITTNLDAKKFAEYCGDALSDRINTGQLFEFKGKTRRKPIVL